MDLARLFLVLIFITSACDVFENEQDLLSEEDFLCEEIPDFFTIVENPPKLIGTLAELTSKIVYPIQARKAGIEGRVTVQFIISETGDVLCPVVVRGIGGGCNLEALRLVTEHAKFEPGMQNGEAVKVQYALPITFSLPD